VAETVSGLQLLAGLLLLLAASVAFAACLRLESVIAFFLATNLFAWFSVVFFTLVLSPAHLVDAASTWAWLLATAMLAAVCWLGTGQPVPRLTGITAIPRIGRTDPAVGMVLLTIIPALVYVAFLALRRPRTRVTHSSTT
jgi:hypothetical protein